MTQEEKELLLKDLCTRSPYGVICQFVWTYSNETTPAEGAIAIHDDNIRCIDLHTKDIRADYYDEWVDVEHCKPYLRPMSSMTEEEGKELEHIFCEMDDPCWVNTYYGVIEFAGGDFIDTEIAEVYTDWLNKKMFDYRGLIEKGLALEAPVDMYQ